MRQSVAVHTHAVPITPSHRRTDLAVSGPLQVGKHQRSLFQNVGPVRHPGHAVATVLHPVQPFGIQGTHPRGPFADVSAFHNGRLHAVHNLLRRKLVAPNVTYPRVIDAWVPADRVARVRHPTRRRAFRAISSQSMCTIGETRGFALTPLHLAESARS